jgi:predicted NBD/HSP70 family sugar kinase
MLDKKTDLGDVTRLRVLDCLRNHGSLARKEIALDIGASPASVTAITAELLGAGLILERQLAPTSGSTARGRPRVMLNLNPEAFLVAGVKVARRSISVVICNFLGEDQSTQTIKLSQTRQSAKDLSRAVHAAIKSACELAQTGTGSLAGIAVGLAGQIDAPRNFVHWSSSLTENGLAFVSELQAAFPCPVFVENDANLVAKAEQLFGIGQSYENFLVVTVEHGVGLGIVIGGQLYRGKRGCGAEFGHTKVQLDGALCQCGQRGCLEAYIGEYALIREMSLGDPGTTVRTARDISALASSGDARACAVLDRAGQMFGIGLANLINIFDPDCLILSGAQSNLGHLFADPVLQRVAASTTDADGNLPPIFIGDLGDSIWAKGAAALAIEQVAASKVAAIRNPPH